ADRAQKPAARGVIQRAPVTAPSNWRSAGHFDAWLKARGMVGVAGVDTRALTTLIRAKGMQNAVIAHAPDGAFDRAGLVAKARALPSMDGADLVPDVTTLQRYGWDEGEWRLGAGHSKAASGVRRVVALDFGVKSNILRLLADAGCDVTVVPADTGADQILAMTPDGIFLANGPGDPAATGRYAVPTIRRLLDAGVPTFGICLGHQMLALAIGADTVKMRQGHHGANHPVKDLSTGKVEIVSMNHGFAVDAKTLPAGARQTHVSLFDGSNCGIALDGRPAFSVQHHPEASPGPRDSHYLFRRFTAMIDANKAA
ncbi:MAG: glutamine-hydrolyzing carbamoyl-phosphate synthase small subunit, partial [Hyphomicrobiales bacterium]|nr:glutamine-hydrolyzing carbamoyl-phosphate synthase small subunit [Hyphomicrobiales bacterium]